MRFAHISDLHIGIVVNRYPMLEDQKYIMNKILEIISDEKVDAVFISGDIYDKPMPTEESVKVFNEFLTNISCECKYIFIISGNHDSNERISFCSEILKKEGVYISRPFSGKAEKTILKDEYGNINVFMLPFVKPSSVRNIYKEDDIGTDYTKAIETALKNSDVDKKERNVLLSHQYVSGSKLHENEINQVGGIDHVAVEAYDDFDYVALGHLHRPQFIKRETLRYCGSPLKYSKGEVENEKSVTIGEIREKGCVELKTLPLVPIKDMRVIKGRFEDLLKESTDDYVYIILTDEDRIPSAFTRLRTVMPNIMTFAYENELERDYEVSTHTILDLKTPYEVFSDFFVRMNDREMNNKEKEFATELISEIFMEEK